MQINACGYAAGMRIVCGMETSVRIDRATDGIISDLSRRFNLTKKRVLQIAIKQAGAAWPVDGVLIPPERHINAVDVPEVVGAANSGE